MKVAALYSGLFRWYEGWEENHKKITAFCNEVHYITWRGKPAPRDKICVRFPEPAVKYAPMHVPEVTKRWPRMQEHLGNPSQMWLTKQIVAHQCACNLINADDYDVVIRMRYDVWLGNHDWKSFIDKVAKEKVKLEK